MALSNIGREPRREITEQVFGLIVLGALIAGDYKFGLWFKQATGGDKYGCPWPLGMLFGVLAGGVLILLWYIAHAIGEIVCDWLKAIRVDPRPRNRY